MIQTNKRSSRSADPIPIANDIVNDIFSLYLHLISMHSAIEHPSLCAQITSAVMILLHMNQTASKLNSLEDTFSLRTNSLIYFSRSTTAFAIIFLSSTNDTD